MTSKPRKFKAKHIRTGEWVTGWYAQYHVPNFDEHGMQVTGYNVVHSLFNDEPSHRSKGGYWQDIDPATLTPLEEQLTLFD